MYRQTSHRFLRRGSRGEDVRRLQELLTLDGHDPGPLGGKPLDGIFGPGTEVAVRAFQQAKSLAVDGIVGPATWRALTHTGTGQCELPRGQSIHIGLNVVDEDAYGMAVPHLRGCLNDARAMQALAQRQGFTTTVLLNHEGTCDNVVAAVRKAAGELREGDFFLLTYAGHGSRIPDLDGDEADDFDDTWVLYNRQLIDDELYSLWGEFARGVRVLVVSDSCHSGTVTRLLRLPYQALAGSVQDSPEEGFVLGTAAGVPAWASGDIAGWRRLRESVRDVVPAVVGELHGGPASEVAQAQVDAYVDLVLSQLPGAERGAIAPETEVRTRDLPLRDARRDFLRRHEEYREAKAAVSAPRPPQAPVLLLAACQEEQLALDGARNGLFTQCLLQVWDDGRFDGVGYPEFHRQIRQLLTAPQQTPNLFWATPVDPRFEQQRPFTL